MNNWNETTRAYFAAQPIWHTKELVGVGIVCLAIGFCVGFIS